MPNQQKPVALVTGANRGLGRETARQLAQQGFAVVVAARSKESADQTAAELKQEGLEATGVALDVTVPDTITAAARDVTQRFGRLDVLVNNAGVAGSGFTQPISTVTADDVTATFETNTLGPIRVTQAFFPLLKKSAAARIVNVSSGMGQLSDLGAGAPAYRLSKTALNAATKMFAIELDGTNAKVNAVCPGWVRTDMGGANAERSVDVGAKSIVWAATLGPDGPTGGFFRDGKRLDW